MRSREHQGTDWAGEGLVDTETAPERPKRGTQTMPASQPADGDNAAPAALRPGDTVGRYEVRGLLGAGGMGQVFTALDPELGRTVALKLLHPEGLAPSSRARTRLLREAQALARLQHPNVVAIHDVGTQGEQVFLAMELVAGQTLGAWLDAAPRPWRAIRDVFVAAGRGLAAAHAVGIIHRDFKPSNVIVGADRVVVVDFGLARGREDECDSDEGDRSPAGVLDVTLTLTGERVGTPRYMSPEQHTGDPVTALADQFAFATSLWTAFYRAPPFDGHTRIEVLQQMATGLRPPPTDRKIPERVRAALARALSLRPSDRWPALDDLLVELGRDPWAARRRGLAIVAVSIAAIAAPVAFVAGRQTPAPSCAAPATGLWDEATRAEVRSAFLASGKPFAGDSFARVDAALHGRLDAWAGAREEACAATEIRHEQSAALMDARMGCLGRARDQIAGFIDVLRAVDARGVERATSSARTVGDLDTCSNVSALTAVLPAPRDPQRAAAVAGVEREVAALGALVLVGRLKDAFAAAPAVVERARALDHPPLLARALYEAGASGCEAGNPRDAAATLHQATRAAAAARDDFLAARAYITLVFCVGSKDKDVQTAQALAEAAEAALARAGTPLELRAWLYREEFHLKHQAGDLIGAFGFAELALMTNQRRYGDDNAEVARSLADVGSMLFVFGAYRGALAMYSRALPILARTRGPTHPVTTAYLSNMAGIAAASGDLVMSAEALEHALASEEQNFGPGGGAARTILRNLSNVREAQGRLEVAQELAQRALALDEKELRPDHPDLAFDLYLLCQLALDRGDLDEAQALSDKSLAIRIAAYGADHPDVADVQVLQAQIARKRGDLAGARGLIEKAMAVHRNAVGERHPTVASDQSVLAAVLLDAGDARSALPILEADLVIQENARNDDADDVVVARTLLAEALLATGDSGRALALAERAVAGARARGLRADIDGRARFALAQALGRADGPRAHELALQSRALLQRWGAADELARIDRWLATARL
jgi:tetratricopeptide (TPR) repeat protein/predicted Ser/Thr protein kinase